jgi:molybdate transport system permease protein
VTQTIPLAIYDYASSPTGTSMALSLCLVSVVLSVAILFVHEGIGKKLENGRSI